MFTCDYLYLPVFSGILSSNVENAISSEKDHQTLWKYCVAYQAPFICSSCKMQAVHFCRRAILSLYFRSYVLGGKNLLFGMFCIIQSVHYSSGSSHIHQKSTPGEMCSLGVELRASKSLKVFRVMRW